ncbi:MAG: hypothetical protein ACO388_08570 [Saprospiraceae bacterium]|jgi:hypothetical protein
MKYNPFKTLQQYQLPAAIECSQKVGCSTWIIYEGEETDDSLKNFLYKILKATGLHPEKDCFVKAIPKDTKGKITLRGMRYLLIFGIPAEQLGWKLKLPLYQSVLVGNCQMLQVEKLTVYYQEINSKSRVKSVHLWEVLKKHFHE